MVFRKAFCLQCCFLLLLFKLGASSDAFLILNQGHNAKLSALAINRDGSTAFSASEDGILKVWNAIERRTIQVVRVSTESIIKIAVHPTKNEVALVEEGSSYRLSIWNWFTGKLVFAQVLNNRPIHVGYSPQGSFLAVSFAKWQSLRFFDTEKAQELPWLKNDTGVVNFFAVSSSESRIMIYGSNTGTLKYLQLRDGKLNHETQTRRELDFFTLLANKRHALGYSDKNIYLIDVLNGRTLKNTEIGELEAIIPLDIENNQFYLLRKDGMRQRLDILTVQFSTFDNDISLRILESSRFSFQGDEALYSAMGSKIFFSLDRLTLSFLDNGNYYPVDVVKTNDIVNLLIHGEWVYVQTDNSIIRFLHTILQKKPGRDMRIDIQIPPVQELFINNPGGFVRLDNERIIIWERDKQMEIYEFDSQSAMLKTIPVQLNAPVRSIRVTDQNLILLDNAGGLYLLSKNNYSLLFSYQLYGIQDAIELHNGNILIAGGGFDRFSSTLLEIDRQTREIISWQYDDDLIFALSPYSDGFFSLGVANQDGIPHTVVRQFNNSSITSQSILRFPKESRGIHMTFIQESDILAVSAGIEGMLFYQNELLEEIEPDNNLALRLSANQDYLWTVNEDGSISLRELPSGELNFRLIGLDDNTILLFFQGDSFLPLEIEENSTDYHHFVNARLGREPVQLEMIVNQ